MRERRPRFTRADSLFPCPTLVRSRGRLAARPVGDVLVEAEKLVKSGVQELLVISQDTSAYGADLKYAKGQWRDREYETRMLGLCEGLAELGAWIRLH